LTDISLDFGDLQVADIYPKRINDLFSAKPVVIHGRFTKSGSGVVKLKGKSFGREVIREIAVNFPENDPNHDVLATLWARTRIDDLMASDYSGIQSGNPKTEIKDTITNLGIEYRLLTQFTSFVAVEERVVTDGGQPRKIEVPVELPEGVSREGIFGTDSNITSQTIQNMPKGTQFTSLLKIAPNVRPQALGGGFQIDGASGSETTVSVTADSSTSIDMTDSSVTTKIDPRGVGFGTGRGDGESSVEKRKRENTFVIDGQEAVNFRTGTLNENKSAALSGKAEKLPKPILSPNKKWDGSDGLVNVRITVDETGKVISAKAESGHENLRTASELAARSATFKIAHPEGNPIQITGIITYNFVLKNKKPDVSIGLGGFAVKLSPEEEKLLRISTKSSSAVFALILRLKNNRAASADEAKFVSGGKADLIVRVKELKPETISELKSLGFEVLTELPSAKAIVGRIAIEKIAELAEIETVTFISPQNR
ncbi:MAG: energy transducer TonB, partial [Pyrinomonadaceae bacterium]